jgi:SAM-dependent methyltransferase
VTNEPPSNADEWHRFDRGAAADQARRFFDGLWADSDPWELEGSEFEQRRYARQLALLETGRYRRALEIGCGGGSFTRLLAPLCAELVAIDISEAAIERARASSDPGTNVEYRVANVMELDIEREGTWDLVVLTETAYYLGWLYPMFDLAWLAHSLHQATRAGGRLLLGNAIWADAEEGLMSPWLIHSYRDLFRNVGYRLEAEESMRGTKNTVEFEVLMSLFVREQ